MTMPPISRRQSLFAVAAGAAGLAVPAVAAAGEARGRRLVVILLRGGLDGLSAVAPVGDPDHETARAGLAPGATGARAGLPLDGFFALHPALSGFASLWAERQLAIVHAVGTPYRDRSHFDAQNVLETGAQTAHGREIGWLNAALAGLPQKSAAARRELAMAIAQQTPLILRGPNPAATWSPSALPDADADTLERLMALYGERDLAMAGALAAARQANMLAEGMAPGGGRSAFISLAEAAGRFLRQPDGPVAAVLELSGWDTHANQTAQQGLLVRSLTQLDQGVLALRAALGPVWSDTVVAVVTEFGRTVAMNGALGTDHGTGGAAFLLGGAVAGGRVVTDWPGLAAARLQEGRDLRVTTDLYAVLKGVLEDHLEIGPSTVRRAVFPDSATAPLRGLVLAASAGPGRAPSS